MDESIEYQLHRGADGSEYRIRVSRTHPVSGRFVPGVRFIAFEDMQNRLLGVAGVALRGSELPRTPDRLDRLLRMACRASRLDPPPAG